MNNIVIIQHEPLNKRIRSIFMIDEMIEAGFKVEYWNMSQYFYKGIRFPDEIEEAYIFDIDSLKNLQAKLDKTDISSTLFIVEVFDIWENRKFFRTLKKKGCLTIKIDLYANALLPVNKWKKFLSENRNGKVRMFKSLVKRRCYSIYKKRKGFLSYDIEFTSAPSRSATPVIYQINHPDYEQYRDLKGEELEVKKPYTVFLDEYFPLHPDIEFFLGIKSSQKNLCDYLKSLNQFFEKFEEQFETRILIALHPKSNFSEKDFGGRQVFKYRTVQLVKHAKFVLLHGSSAVSFAVMNNVPLMTCVTDDYKTKYKMLYTYAHQVHLFLQSAEINIDHLPDVLPFPAMNKEKAEEYKYSYLTSLVTENASNKEIIIRYLQSLEI